MWLKMSFLLSSKVSRMLLDGLAVAVGKFWVWQMEI